MCRVQVKGGASREMASRLAEAGEKFRENNEEIKRRNVCTHVSRGRTLGGYPSFVSRTFPSDSVLCVARPRNVSCDTKGTGIEIAGKML